MIKSIAIEKTNDSFLPESYAYRDYFRKHGYKCNFVEKGSKEALEYDAILLFHGFHPFWNKYPQFVISEYHSLSTGKFNRFKDFLKRVVNVRGQLYIFLNEDVREKLWFSRKTNYITRRMGFSPKLVNESSSKKEFDIIYCGSYREGVLAQIYRLAELGLVIALVGFDHQPTHYNVKCFGKVSTEQAMKLIGKSKIGLNYTPDIFPYNIQDSTKVIEYCALNLGVITNRYKWIDEFEKNINAKFLNIDDIESRDDIITFDFNTPNISFLTWSAILDSSNILEKIRNLTI